MDIPIADTVSTYVMLSSPRQTVCLFKNLTRLRPQVCLRTNLLTMITTQLAISHYSGKSQQHLRRAILWHLQLAATWPRPDLDELSSPTTCLRTLFSENFKNRTDLSSYTSFCSFFFLVQVQRNIWSSKNIWFILRILFAESFASFHKLTTQASLFLEGRCYVVYYITHLGLIKNMLVYHALASLRR